jgi:hypothetical protein
MKFVLDLQSPAFSETKIVGATCSRSPIGATAAARQVFFRNCRFTKTALPVNWDYQRPYQNH